MGKCRFHPAEVDAKCSQIQQDSALGKASVYFFNGICGEHGHEAALCSVGQAELEARLRGDIESLGQVVIRLTSRLRECKAECAKMREALVRQLLAHGVTATEALDQAKEEE